MKTRMQFTMIFFVLILMASACTTAEVNDPTMEKPTEGMMEKPTETMPKKPTDTMIEQPTKDMMEDQTATPEDMQEKSMDQEMMETPAWFSATFTNVSSGQTFSIHDFKGKVILVEAMAQWCSNCKKQQNEVRALHEKLGMNQDLITIALDIDPNENGDTLKQYAASNGFDWIYAVSSEDVSRELGNLYGAQFLNPPSTPILIIDREGTAHLLPFGIKSADDLFEAIKPYLDEGM